MPHPSEVLPSPDNQDPRIREILGARNQLQFLLMQRWGSGDETKALEWSEAYSRVFREVFPPHIASGERRFLALEKMDAFSRSGAMEGEQILKDVQDMLDEYLREHPEMRVDTVN